MKGRSNLPKSLNLAMGLIAASVMSIGAAQAKDVTDADILNDAKTPGDVVSFGLGTQGQRFSALNQINAQTKRSQDSRGRSGGSTSRRRPPLGARGTRALLGSATSPRRFEAHRRVGRRA